MRERKKTMSMIGLALTLSAACTMLAACSDNPDDDGNGGGGTPAGNKEITVTPERNAMLRNPMNGWVMYTGLGDGLADGFWESYDNFDSAKGKVKVSDYSNVLYVRAAWSLFNPEEGRYVWDDGADFSDALAQRARVRYKYLVKGAEERGMKLAFTFVVDSRDKAFDFSPAFVKNDPDVEGFTSGTNGARWSPYPDDPGFQKHFENFIKAFAAKYDDPDVTEFVSGFGLGLWGEGHTMIYKGGASAKEGVFKWAVDMHTRNITKVPLIINYHRVILSTGGFTNTIPADTEGLLDYAVEKGYSLRHDAYGMKTYYSTWEKNYVAGKRFKRPVIGEGGWVKITHGGSIKGDGYADHGEVRYGEFEDARDAHANMLDFRYSGNIENGETYIWFNEAYELVEQFISEGGYRLYPDRLTLPETIYNGSKATITSRWLNLGWGYCPTNIPQWKDKYKIAFALLDKNDDTPKYVFVDSAPELSTIIKGSPQNFTFSTTVSGVPTGNYTWAVGIVDTTKDNNDIGIFISAKNNVTEKGWVRLFDVTVK